MTGHIFIEGEVGVNVTLKSVREDISNYPQAEDFVVHINSVGGDVYEGYAIGSAIKSLGKPTTASIGALCASISTYIASCADTIIMGPVGDFMIHLPTGTLQGTADDLRKGAEQLDRIKNELISSYLPRVAKMGITRDMLSEMLDKETSMSPQQAKAMGFVDEVQEKLKAVAKWDYNKIKNMEKEKEENVFDKFFAKLDKFFDSKLKEVKNAVTVALADGSQIQSDADTPDNLVGSTLTDETGATLAAGTYETADGISLVVDDSGKVVSADPIMNDAKDDTVAKLAALEQENATLKQQLAEANTKAQAEAKTTAKKDAEFKNILSEVRAEVEKLKNQTFGDAKPPVDAPDKKFKNEVETDPMLDAMAHTLGQAFITSRR